MPLQRLLPLLLPSCHHSLDLPADVLQSRMPHLAENRSKFKLWGIYARLKWCSHFATLTTSPSLYSDTTSTILHPEADRPLTVRWHAHGKPACLSARPPNTHASVLRCASPCAAGAGVGPRAGLPRLG